jgi:hypothetical protein
MSGPINPLKEIMREHNLKPHDLVPCGSLTCGNDA